MFYKAVADGFNILILGAEYTLHRNRVLLWESRYDDEITFFLAKEQNCDILIVTDDEQETYIYSSDELIVQS